MRLDQLGLEVVASAIRRRLAPPRACLVAASILFWSASWAEEAGIEFAIFPSQSIVSCFEDVDWRYVEPVRRLLEARPGATLAFSFYAPGTDRTVLPPLRELWTPDAINPQPALDTVTAAGRRLGVDAVLMAWIRCSSAWSPPSHLYWVEVYVVDVESRRMFRARARADRAGDAATRAIEAFFAARGAA